MPAEVHTNTSVLSDSRPGEHFHPMGCSRASVRLFYLDELRYVADTHTGIEFLTALVLGLAALGGLFSEILIRTGRDKFKWRRPILMLWFRKLI